jgi:pimeloyl-ACP methyl ester carboxylesterase
MMRHIGIGIAILSAVGACDADQRDSSAESAIAATAAPPALAEGTSTEADAASRARRIAFEPCVDDPELECGELSVPIDYSDPRGDQVALAVVRAPAFTSRKKGIIFTNPGGPGGSGVDFVIFVKELFAPLRADFDIVSFDPRGTARSSEAFCLFDLPPAPTSDTLEANAAFLDEAGARYAQACRDQHGNLATQIGTNNVARDIDMLRAALGESTINYLGFSYGTILGASYAALFPRRVRAMVLDAAATPAWFNDYLLELDADGSAGAELALRRLDQLCRAAADCPLRTAGVVAVFDRLVERLDRNPIVVGDRVFNGASVRIAVFGGLFNELIGWPSIVDTLVRADAGDVSGLVPRPLTPSTTAIVPSTFAIVCNDSATRRSGLDYLPAQLGNDAVYPRFGGANFGLAITLCSSWPSTRTTPISNLETRNKVVVIGNDFDNATPMAWVRNMTTALGSKATFVRYQGGGHIIYGSGSACIDTAIESYFRDPTRPPTGLVCPAQQLTFGTSSLRATRTPTIADAIPRVTPRPPIILPRR